MPVDRYQNSTNYVHPQESNLLDVHKAMQYNDNGEPELRVNASGITLSGDVNIGDVTVTGTVAVSNFPSSFEVNQGTTPWTITGTVEVNNFPQTVQVTQGTDPWNITGTVNIGTVPEVEIKNDLDNPIPVSANTATNSESNPLWVRGTSDTSFFDPTQSDAFGRLRVSNPLTLWDSFHRYQDNGKISIYTTGTSTSTHDAYSSSILMTVGTTQGDACYRESLRVFAYQPGKSLLIFQTFTMDPGKAGLRQRIGYFDTDNGLYLENDQGTLYFVRRSSSSGSIQETRIIQTDWNINTIPQLDISKSQILWWDIEWLGVGSVRCGFVINGQLIHCHTFHHANTNTSTYMGTAILPVRAEIENVSDTDSSSTYRQICTSVISEGGYNLTGRPFSIGHELTAPYDIATQNTNYPIFSIRLKNNRKGALAMVKAFSIAVGGNVNYKYMILTGGKTTGGSWVDAGANSSIEYNLTPATYTATNIVDWGYIINSNQSSSAPLAQETPFKYQLERNTFTGECYEFIIVLSASTGNQDAWVSVLWEEIT